MPRAPAQLRSLPEAKADRRGVLEIRLTAVTSTRPRAQREKAFPRRLSCHVQGRWNEPLLSKVSDRLNRSIAKIPRFKLAKALILNNAVSLLFFRNLELRGTRRLRSAGVRGYGARKERMPGKRREVKRGFPGRSLFRTIVSTPSSAGPVPGFGPGLKQAVCGKFRAHSRIGDIRP